MAQLGLSGVADGLPGPAMAAALASVDPASFTDEDLVSVLRAEYRQRGHHEARHLAALVAIGRARLDADGTAELNEWAPSEIAAALALTHTTADRELEFARMVVLHLPSVHTALYEGRLDRGKAWVFADLLADLTPEQRAALCAHTVAEAEGWTTGRLRARLQRLIIEVDPEWARRRHQRALKGRQVVAYLTDDGTVTLTGSGLPACEAASADARIAALARRIRRAGHPAPLDHIRADVYLGLLDGTLQPLDDTQIIAEFLRRATGEALGALGPPTGIEIRVGVSTLLGLDDRCGEVPGLGPVLAEEARAQVARQHRGGEWRFAVTDPEGRLIVGGLTRRRPTGIGGTSRGGIVELQISEELLARLVAAPEKCGRWAPVLSDIAARSADRSRTLARLDERPTDRFAPADLSRHVQLRDRQCVGVGCRRAAVRCDIDHTQDYALGGRTVTANAGPCCPRCHGYKTRGWWRLSQPRPGFFRWVSPLGQVYRTRGDPITPPTIPPIPRPSPQGDDTEPPPF